MKIVAIANQKGGVGKTRDGMGVTFLEADVVDGEGNQFFFGHFVGIFVMMRHRTHSLSF